MVRIAPRYDARLVAAIDDLDDGRVPVAELCRRVGCVADELGVPRPSYPHVWRLVRENRLSAADERRRSAALRGIAADVANDLVRGRRVVAYEVAGRVRKGSAPR